MLVRHNDYTSNPTLGMRAKAVAPADPIRSSVHSNVPSYHLLLGQNTPLGIFLPSNFLAVPFIGDKSRSFERRTMLSGK